MGRRQAPVVAGAAPFLSRPDGPLLRTLRRQRRRLLRSRVERTPERPRRGAERRQRRSDRLLPARRRSLDEVAAALERLAADHAVRGRDCYMQVRDGQFNPLRAAWRERGADLDDYPAELAAMLIYLNRTGYNGLFRLNASGEFNVPPGRYDSPKVIDRPLLARVSRSARLTGHPHRARGVRSRAAGSAAPATSSISIRRTRRSARTANFRGYTGRGFSDADQERLQQVAHRARGARRPGAAEQFRGAVDEPPV